MDHTPTPLTNQQQTMQPLSPEPRLPLGSLSPMDGLGASSSQTSGIG